LSIRSRFLLSVSLQGALIFAIGDTIASVLQHQFSWTQLLGVFVISGTLYAWETPLAFRWIDRTVKGRTGVVAGLTRAFLALVYFNPIWIARHMLFLLLFSGRWEEIGWHLLLIATKSWAASVPVSMLANYIIQNKIKMRRRYIASAVFSGNVAIYYALSVNWFK